MALFKCRKDGSPPSFRVLPTILALVGSYIKRLHTNHLKIWLLILDLFWHSVQKVGFRYQDLMYRVASVLLSFVCFPH